MARAVALEGAGDPEPRPGRRLAAAGLGLLGVALAAVLYSRLGALGVGLGPSAALVLAALPAFVAVPLALRMGTHGRYPLGLAGPSLAFYVTFFCIPIGFLCLFAVATPVGFGEVTYGFDTTSFSAALERVYVDAFLRTLRSAAIGTVLTVLVGYPFAYWLARYAPARRKSLLLALVIVPFWTCSWSARARS